MTSGKVHDGATVMSSVDEDSYGRSPVNMYAAELYGFYMASPISQNGYIFFNEDLIMVTYSYGNISIFNQIILVASLSVP